MSNKAISDYTALPTAIDADDLLLIERGGVYYKATYQVLSNGLLRVTLALTQAQIQAGNTTPITIQTAPGTGYYIEVEGGMARLNHNGTTYATATALTIVYNGQTDVVLETSTSFIQATSTLSERMKPNNSGAANQKMYLNTAIDVRLDADATNNGGSIDVVLLIRLENFA